jgi:ubiquinone/menaquinone biosynthesis C-methylase UbiE
MSFLYYDRILENKKGIVRMDVGEYNKIAWNREVELGNIWTIPVSPDEIRKAKKGEWKIWLTPSKPIPRNWFPNLTGSNVLCLASGGGQQGPILASVGARVTVLDRSPKQLEQDHIVARRESLDITIVEGDMSDLSMFKNQAFDLIIHPVSNIFTRNIQPVWIECYRVLRKEGVLLSGLTNPAMYLFDYKLADETGILQVKYSLPYSDLGNLDKQELEQMKKRFEPVEFSHTLDELIGGQLRAGFTITGFYEDSHREEDNDLLSKHMQTFFATRACKLL